MEFFLAWKYFKPQRNAVSLITLISLAGVALGVAVLIVVLAVMTGFTDMMKKKLLETTSHIQIYDYYNGYVANPEKVLKAVKKSGATGLPVTMRQVLIQRNNKFVPKGVIGINTDEMPPQFNLKKMIKHGKFSLEKGEAIVSSRIANELRLGEGSKMLVHSPSKLAKMVEMKKGGGIQVKKQTDVYLPDEYKISGIYSFGKYDFDKNFIFINRDDANDLLEIPWGGASAVYVWAEDPFDLDDTVKAIKKELPFMSVVTWMELKKQLLGVLQMEKDMMFFLLIFIVLVAAFSITNTLITVVVQKTREIGLLKALGASSFSVMTVFILQGFFVGLIGSLSGTILGSVVIQYRHLLIDFLRETTNRPIFPAELYVFNELPANIVMNDLIWINAISIVLCTLGAVIPAWRAARLEPAKALRYE